MSAHAANSRLANSFSSQTHTTARSPPIETGNVADNSVKPREGSVSGGPPCNGARPSAPPCSAAAINSAKSVNSTCVSASGVCSSDHTSKHVHTNSTSNSERGREGGEGGGTVMYSARGLTSAADRGHSGNSAVERNHRLASTVDRSQNNAGGADRSHSHTSTAERSGSNAGDRSSPGAVRRGGEAGRQSRMDATGFRFRLRKGGGEGVTKKGPMVAKHPSASTSPCSTTTAPTSTLAHPTTSSAAKEQVRSPVGAGPPLLGSHRRRPVSPDPRPHPSRPRPTPPPPRDSPRTSPRTSPRSSPKSSPVRQLRERSVSPRRYASRGGGGGGGGGVSSRGSSTRVTPSPPGKRSTPPTSPRARRQRSPSSNGTTRRHSPRLADPSARATRPRTLPSRTPPAPTTPSSPVTPIPTPLTPVAAPGPITTTHIPTSTQPRVPSPTPTPNHAGVSSRRPPSPSSSSSGGRAASPSTTRPPSPRGTSPRGRGASPGSRGPAMSEEAVRARVRRALRARLYLLHQPGPNSFTVGGDSPTHKYKVIIGPQTCSCGHGPYCVHVLFVMVRVLQVAEVDPVLVTGALKDYEVEQLMNAYQERLTKAARKRRSSGGGSGVGGQLSVGKAGAGGGVGGRHTPSSTPSTSISGPSAAQHQESSSGEDEPQCPICLMCMVEGESLVTCEGGCRNLLHHHCMSVWAAHRHAQGLPLLCPLCRAPWPLKHYARLTPTQPHRHGRTESPPYSSTRTTAEYSAPIMSASFSGVSYSGRQSPSEPMTRSLTSAYPSSSSNFPPSLSHYPPPTAQSPYTDSAYSSPAGGSAYPPTVRGEVSAAIVASASESAVPLPRSEPIPAEHEKAAAEWVRVFGPELVGCLFSRDWAVRETGLRRLSHEVVKVLHWDRLVTQEEERSDVVNCCANILAQVANDPVYKVYLACLRCLRALLAHLSPTSAQVGGLRELFRPLVHTLLLKCADGNRRTSQISVDSILELCRGQEGELALATQLPAPTPTMAPAPGPGLGGISFVLSCILDDVAPQEAPWQWLLGRLCVLERLLDTYPSEFQLQYQSLQPAESGYKLQHYDRLMTVVEFAFRALGSSHATVAKLARRVYICGARFAAAEPAVFHQVCDMLAKLDVSLQMRLKRRLRSMQGTHGDRRAALARLEGKLSLATWDLGDTAGPRLVRSVSHSPSRMLAALRSSSQSPARQPAPSPSPSQAPVSNQTAKKDSERSVKGGPPGPTSSPPRPTHLPLDCFEAKFKEKQAKLRLYHKTRGRQDTPFLVQHVAVSPGLGPPQPRPHRWGGVGGSLYKGGLSQSQGDALDVSPQTPVAAVAPPRFSFKDVVSTPATPTAPHCTPVKETGPGLDGQGQGVGEDPTLSAQQAPFPVIPGLDLLPAHLGDAVHPYEQNVEGGQYEEGRDWVKGPLLGTGAFSSCYQARDVRTGTLMAVKQVSFCRNSEKEQERVEASVEEEILIMSRLNHGNIVRLLGASRHSTSFSVFTEWMAGGSVATMLDKYGIFSEQVILKYTRQVLAGLAYLHDNKILHRDLKGANLLVDSTGHWLRIADFGTAARMASKSTVTGEFQGQLLGTIAFMAPEVLRGEDYGRSCDVWSVGCCVIEMATTKPPWGADYVSNQLKLMYKIATSSGPPSVPDTLSDQTRDLALRCLEIRSEDRPPARELIQHPCFKTQPP